MINRILALGCCALAVFVGWVPPSATAGPPQPATDEEIKELIAAAGEAKDYDDAALVYVLDEAAALGLPSYFASIYGALDDYQNYSKKMVIERILDENHLSGPEFVTFGDGYVEIEDTKAIEGIAVGVASDEVNRQGINEWKREKLIQAGADLIIPDFREHERLVAYLFMEN